jgi:uncharacterized protein
MKNRRDAAYWIRHLDLRQHPEGGYFRETYRSDESIHQASLPKRFNSDRNFSTAIYYLLKSGEFSSFHRIKSDEVWHFYEGDPLVLHVINADGAYSKILLGRDVVNGEILQYCIRHGDWFAAEIKYDGLYALVGCTVAPGFDFTDFELAVPKDLLQLFPLHSELISRLTL